MNNLNLVVMVLIIFPLVFAAACVIKEVPVVERYYETEYRTEYKTESYTETENVVVSIQEGKKYLKPIVEWHDRLSFRIIAGIDSTYYYGYKLQDWDFDPSGHSKIQVKVGISRLAQQQKGTIVIYDLTGFGQIPPLPTRFGYDAFYYYAQWYYTTLVPALSNARIVGELHMGSGEETYFIFDAKGMTDFAILVNSYSYYTISSVELTWSDDVIEQKTVTKERQVPYQVPVEVQKQRTVIKTERVPFWEPIVGD